MKKIKYFLGAFAVCSAIFALSACSSNISQGYADKLNKEAQDGDDDYYSYDKVMKDLGNSAVDRTVAVANSHSGIIYAVKGCKTWDDIQKKLDEGKDVEGLVVTILANRATAASYQKITGQEK